MLVAAHWGRLSRPCPYYFLAVLLLVFYSFPSASLFKLIIIMAAKNRTSTILRRYPKKQIRNLDKVAVPFDG